MPQTQIYLGGCRSRHLTSAKPPEQPRQRAHLRNCTVDIEGARVRCGAGDAGAASFDIAPAHEAQHRADASPNDYTREQQMMALRTCPDGRRGIHPSACLLKRPACDTPRTRLQPERPLHHPALPLPARVGTVAGPTMQGGNSAHRNLRRHGMSATKAKRRAPRDATDLS
eukprot:CAMPEP_0176269896 /NCGR_PEP_ID=MMETSP0121_2-20121125/44422_1 /TAXON_ID=160619 /ORGANISM="Kryptoperidinium foliaceum, Strain CCMP 1326" /LENGTH=169 /DNA_ID=CAMNT_0017610027 /DNA_START=54 /DNA_END=565 /DNA_ORIENTATION=+